MAAGRPADASKGPLRSAVPDETEMTVRALSVGRDHDGAGERVDGAAPGRAHDDPERARGHVLACGRPERRQRGLAPRRDGRTVVDAAGGRAVHAHGRGVGFDDELGGDVPGTRLVAPPDDLDLRAGYERDVRSRPAGRVVEVVGADVVEGGALEV